jgi:hypothetical protein
MKEEESFAAKLYSLDIDPLLFLSSLTSSQDRGTKDKDDGRTKDKG